MKKVLTLILALLAISGSIMGFTDTKTAKAEPSFLPLPEDYKYSGREWNEPSTVRIVDEQVLNSLVDHRADGKTQITYNGKTYIPKLETYNPADRIWQGLPSVVKVGKRIWVCWYTGGLQEPDPFNYTVMAYSDDGGKTFVEPYIVIDHPDLDGKNIMNVVPNLWVDPDGNMWLFYLQSYLWGIKFHNAGAADVKDMTWDEPRIIGSFKTNQPPTAIINQNGQEEWLFTSESQIGESHPEETRIYSSLDKGVTWTLKSRITSSAAAARKWPESQIVQTKSGKLILISRLEKGTVGGMEVAYSNDYGATWTPYQNNLDKPFIGPGSKAFILKLSSGNLLMVNHDTTSSRSAIKAYLSKDEGNTWPYSISIDKRDDVSYPSAFEVDGVIYIVWDKGRYIEKEIRLSVLTEEDIIAGQFISKVASSKNVVSKTGPYKDIVSIKENFDRTVTVKVGTPSSELKSKLPTALTVVDEDGEEYTLNGVWTSKGYKQDKAGYYLFEFEPDSMPLYLQDGRDILTVRIQLVENTAKPKKGCKSAAAAAIVSTLSLLFIAVIKNK
jgi:hypothetical protein